MPLSEKLQLTLATKAALKQALIDKGAEVGEAPFSSYPSLIGALSSGFPVGTLADWKIDGAASGWLVCDGSAVGEAAYPALYAVVGDVHNDGGEPAGYFRLPTYPPTYYGNVRVLIMIKGES